MSFSVFARSLNHISAWEPYHRLTLNQLTICLSEVRASLSICASISLRNWSGSHFGSLSPSQVRDVSWFAIQLVVGSAVAGSGVATRAGEVVGVTWYELRLERLRDEGLDGKGESGGLSVSRVPSIELSVVSWDNMVGLLVMNWPFDFVFWVRVLVETVGLHCMGGMFIGV